MSGGELKSVRSRPHATSSDVSGGTARARNVCAFTLIELLVVMVIVAAVAATIIPAVSGARSQMMQVKCSSNLRSVALHFQLFAEGGSALDQGDSVALGPRRFRITDFLDSLYRVDEFWDDNDQDTIVLRARDEQMMCPAGPPRLEKHRGFSTSTQALEPPENVSLGVNMRLYRASVKVGNHTALAPVNNTFVNSGALNHPYVPIVIDVDGEKAAERGIEPFYTAPARPEHIDPYSSGRYWIPSLRHRGQANVAFIGGHVLSSPQPRKEGWNWQYQADAGN